MPNKACLKHLRRGSAAEAKSVLQVAAQVTTQAAEAWRKRLRKETGVYRIRQKVLITAHMTVIDVHHY